MGVNNKFSGVFSYSIFWFSIILPIMIATILMAFIIVNDNLSPEWPSKGSLAIFLKYMEVPLWIFGSSIPLATLAAANYRAIQFQKNLDFQKRNLDFQKINLERQELEHVVDLYHKELTLFKEKFEAIIYNGNFRCIRPEDATMVYTRFYPKPKQAGDYIFKIDEVRLEYVFDFIKIVEKNVFSIAKYNNVVSFGSELKLKCIFIEKFLNKLSERERCYN
ncbi:hypothetical protein [Pseudoalteromonas luteoviolacea]|uniref:hypothetical protein n=1 Tax=Pseudoalteromonas luteoviolacea TaxID=43657 RepID=UPI00163C12C8|nr:hypothetical protein [Pseudoalteromonas luteoviolacea]